MEKDQTDRLVSLLAYFKDQLHRPTSNQPNQSTHVVHVSSTKVKEILQHEADDHVNFPDTVFIDPLKNFNATIMYYLPDAPISTVLALWKDGGLVNTIHPGVHLIHSQSGADAFLEGKGCSYTVVTGASAVCSRL
jgi:hypothetical protein